MRLRRSIAFDTIRAIPNLVLDRLRPGIPERATASSPSRLPSWGRQQNGEHAREEQRRPHGRRAASLRLSGAGLPRPIHRAGRRVQPGTPIPGLLHPGRDDRQGYSRWPRHLRHEGVLCDQPRPWALRCSHVPVVCVCRRAVQEADPHRAVLADEEVGCIGAHLARGRDGLGSAQAAAVAIIIGEPMSAMSAPTAWFMPRQGRAGFTSPSSPASRHTR